MPQIDLLGMYAGAYHNTNGVVTYDTPVKVGDAMTCNLELTFAEGRLYAEGALAEMVREAIGGKISIGVKYIIQAAQQLLYGMQLKTRSITYTPAGSQTAVTENAVSLAESTHDEANYVGVSFIAPDMIDRVKKYTCFFVPCSIFGAPSYSLKTKGDSIQFATPTTTGEFLPANTGEGVFREIYVANSLEAAHAWGQTVFTPTT